MSGRIEAVRRWGLVAQFPAPLKARFARNKLAVAGLVVVVLFLGFCFIGPLLYSTDQTHTDLTQVNLAPNSSHWLGTDAVGHDQLGRLM